MTPSPLSCDAKEKLSYVYLLQSQKDRKYYLGWTTDLLRRLGEHNEGLNSSTKSRKPFKLIGFESYLSQNEAKEREFALKKNPKMYRNFKKRVSLRSPASLTQIEGMG